MFVGIVEKTRLGPFCVENVKIGTGFRNLSVKRRSLLRVIRDVSGLID